MYAKYPLTTDPYLDGRYFKAVVGVQPGVIAEPIIVELGETPTVSAEVDWLQETINYVRLVVRTPTLRHCVLLSVDLRLGEAEIWDPVSDVYADTSYQLDLRYAVSNLLLPADCSIDYTTALLPTSYPVGTSLHRGYCNAFVLREVLDRLTGEFESNNEPGNEIRRFCSYIKSNYQLPPGKPDIEYGPGFGLGLLTGALVGGAIVAGTSRPKR